MKKIFSLFALICAFNLLVAQDSIQARITADYINANNTTNLITGFKHARIMNMLNYRIINTENNQWRLGGNSGTNSIWLGTNNNFPVIFKTNNTERGRFSNEGYFGLGTASPAYLLDVDARALGGNPLRLQGLQSGTASTDSLLVLSNGVVRRIAPATSLLSSSCWSLSGNTTTSSDFIGTTNNQDLIFKRGGEIKARIDGVGLMAGYATNYGGTDFTNLPSLTVVPRFGAVDVETHILGQNEAFAHLQTGNASKYLRVGIKNDTALIASNNLMRLRVNDVDRMSLNNSDFLYRNQNGTNRFEINQSGAALRGDTAKSFSYNLYIGAYKKFETASNAHEGIWLENYFFASKGDSLITTTGNNNNGVFINKTRRKASWMGYGTAPDSGYIAGASGIEVLYGHSMGGSEDARTGTVKGINIYPYQLSGYIGNHYGLYFQTNNVNNARVTGKNYGIFMENGASGWTNVIHGNTGFGNENPQYKVDVNSVNPIRLIGLQEGAITDSILSSSNGIVRRLAISQIASNSTWLTGGSAVTSIQNLGTTSNFALPFITNNTERMRITETGILRLSNTVQNRRLVLWQDADNEHQYWGLGVNAGIMRYQVSANTVSHAFFAGNDANNSNELMRIQGNGNVGIGISSAQNKLHVSGVNPLRLDGLQEGATTDSVLTTNSGVVRRLSISQITANNWNFGGNAVAATQSIGTTTNFDLPFITNNTEKARITTSGQLAIGTTTPNASAILDLTSTDKGLLLPRLTTAQIDAMVNPPAGLIVFDNSVPCLKIRGANGWEVLGTSFLNTTITTSTSYTANSTNRNIFCSNASNDITITLPPYATTPIGFEITVSRGNTSGGNVSIQSSSPGNFYIQTIGRIMSNATNLAPSGSYGQAQTFVLTTNGWLNKS